MELLVPKRQSMSIEPNGERVVSASAIECVCVKERKVVRAFGEVEPMAWLDFSPPYRLELSQLSDLGQGISRSSLWEMSDFHLVTVQDSIRTVYNGYEWQELTEQMDTGNGFLAEYAVTTARKRGKEEESI